MTCFSGDEEKQVIWKNFFMVYGNLPLSYAEYFTFNVKFTHRQDPNPDPPPQKKKIPGVRIWFIRIRTVSFCFVLFLLHFAHYSLLFNNNKIIYRYGTNACVAGCLLKRRPSCRRAAALSSVPTVPHPAGWNS